MDDEKAMTKTDGGVSYSAGDYADVEDPEKPSTWKLRLAEGKSGNYTVAQVGRAITALQPGGFRGNRVEIGTSKDEVVKKINAAIGKTDGDTAQKKNLRERLDAVKVNREKAATEHGHDYTETCEKCEEYPAIVAAPYRVAGGATSFATLFAYREAQQLESAYSMATWDYRDLSNNILNDPEMDSTEKADAMVALVNEFQRVVRQAPELYAYKDDDDSEESAEKVGRRLGKSQVSTLKQAYEMLRKLFHWSSYEDDKPDGDDKALDISFLDAPDGSGFKVFRTKEGVDRWLAFSSNAFKDKDEELFTTKALEEAVDYADETGEHGPLRIYHVPSADVGVADYQAVIGRFLVESGTFNDDELGQKAVAYFKSTDEEHQISIGFQFKSGDEKDGVFDWVRIKERSVTPKGAAANPYTSFAIGELEGGEVDDKKKSMLTKVFGEELAPKIIAKAEEQTKALEDEGVTFKSSDASGDGEKAGPLDDLKKLVADKDMPDGLKKKIQGMIDGYNKADDKKDDDAGAPSGDPPAASPAADASDADASVGTEAVVLALQELGKRIDDLGSVKEAVTALQAEVKEIKEREPAPRAAGMFRASEHGTALDPEKAKELLGDKEEEPKNPIAPYIEDIIGAR